MVGQVSHAANRERIGFDVRKRAQHAHARGSNLHLVVLLREISHHHVRVDGRHRHHGAIRSGVIVCRIAVVAGRGDRENALAIQCIEAAPLSSAGLGAAQAHADNVGASVGAAVGRVNQRGGVDPLARIAKHPHNIEVHSARRYTHHAQGIVHRRNRTHYVRAMAQPILVPARRITAGHVHAREILVVCIEARVNDAQRTVRAGWRVWVDLPIAVRVPHIARLHHINAIGHRLAPCRHQRSLHAGGHHIHKIALHIRFHHHHIGVIQDAIQSCRGKGDGDRIQVIKAIMDLALGKLQ